MAEIFGEDSLLDYKVYDLLCRSVIPTKLQILFFIIISEMFRDFNELLHIY